VWSPNFLCNVSMSVQGAHTFASLKQGRHIPWLDQVCSREDSAQDDAESSDHHVRNSQERIAASNHRACGDNDALRPSIDIGWEMLIDVHPICPHLHHILVIPLRELTKCRQASCPHPDLEGLVGLQIWGRVRVSIGVTTKALHPVRRHGDLIVIVLRRAVELLVAIPGDPGVVLHGVYPAGLAAAGDVQEDGRVESIIEHGICDQAAWIVRPATGIETQRVAEGSRDGVVVDSDTTQLVLLERLHVASMVLIEVCEAVVEEDGRLHWRWNIEDERALRDVVQHDAVRVGVVDGLPRPGGFRCRVHHVFEVPCC